MNFPFPFIDILTIPTDAGPGDERVVIDGINGRIDVFDASNNLIGRFGPVSGTMFIAAFDPSGARAFLSASGGAAQLVLDPPDWAGHVIVPGTIQGDIDTGTGQPFIVIGSPTVDGGDDARIFIFGETTGGAIPAVYIDGGSGLPADLLLNGLSLPRGHIHYAVATGNSPALAAIGGVQTLAGTLFTITNNSGMTRRYKVTATARVNGGPGLYRVLVTNGTTTALGPGTQQFRTVGTGGANQEGSQDIHVFTLAAGASQTVGAGGLRASGGAATDVFTVGEILVEDIGGP